MIRNLIAIVAATAALGSASASEILYNQVGYYPEKPKIIFVIDSPEQGYEIFDQASGQSVISGGLGEEVSYPAGGVSTRRIDFSNWTTPGTYFIRLQDNTESGLFTIGLDELDDARAAALKSFYFNRATQEITIPLGGKWARPLGHPDDRVRYHSSTRHADGFAASPKGWYDAGDYGKYIVNGGYAVGTLLSLHELLPGLTDDETGIPESGNGVSDLLDEARWELEWFLTMQDSDGGVFHKCTTLNFEGFVMPHRATAQRYFIGKSVTATLNFAAVCGQAGRVYANIDAPFADACLKAAERAWTWAKANPSATYQQPSGVNTGAYSDGNPADEFEWAAAQLYLTTGKSVYKNALNAVYSTASLDAAASWPGTRNLAIYSLATVDAEPARAYRSDLRISILYKAQDLLAQIEANPIRSSLGENEFNWGSNGTAAAKGVLLAYAYAISGEARYAEGMAEIADYLLGRNATGYSFLTGFGPNSPRFIHHRPSGADAVDDPVPGFLAGGPNNARQDGQNYPYPTSQPARAYLDVEASYASNEIAINWNAPLVFLLSALQATQPAAFSPKPDHLYMAPVDFGYGNVLANDSSNPGAQLAAALLTRPRLGEFDFNESNGVFTFTGTDLPYGNYYFSYRSSFAGETSDPITVTISIVPTDFDRNGAVPTAYEAWLLNYPNLSGDDAAPTADPDHDGFTNLWESILLGDPTQQETALPGGLQMLSATKNGNVRLQLTAVADALLGSANLQLLVKTRIDSADWLVQGQNGAPAFGVTASEPDLQTGLAQIVWESKTSPGESIFLTIRAEE